MTKLNATTYSDVAANTVNDAVLDAAKILAWYLNLKDVVNENSPEGRYAADVGSTDTYAITLDPVPTTYVTGMIYRFKAATLNTGAATLNVNTIGAKTIKKNVLDDLETGDILANQLIEVMYDGTNMQLISASSELKTHKSDKASDGVHGLGTTADTTYYLDGTNGNDSNNGTTSVTAFKTWAKVASMIPTFGEHNYTVNIIGNYTGDMTLSNKKWGGKNKSLTVKGNTTTPGSQVITGDIYIVGCTGSTNGTFANPIKFQYLNVVGLIFVGGSQGVYITGCEPRNSGGAGIKVENSLVQIDNCNFGTSVVQDAILAASSSTVSSAVNTGTATRYGLNVGSAATIGKSSTQPTGTTANENAVTGGVIR